MGAGKITRGQAHGDFFPNICSGASVSSPYPEPIAMVGLGVLVPGGPKGGANPKQRVPGAPPASHLQRTTQGGGGGNKPTIIVMNKTH